MAVKKNKCYSGHRLYPENNGQIYDCDGCKTKGVGLTYRCRACDFDRHPECMNSTDTISPDICQGQHLKFCKQPPPPANQKSRKAKDLAPSVCSACGMGVEGFVYHSKETGTYLHPRCAFLKAEIPVLAPAAAAAADHPAVKFILKKESKNCDVCQSAELMNGVDEKIPGWCYSCIDDGGGEHAAYHVYCLMKLLREAACAKMKEGDGGSGGGSSFRIGGGGSSRGAGRGGGEGSNRGAGSGGGSGGVLGLGAGSGGGLGCGGGSRGVLSRGSGGARGGLLSRGSGGGRSGSTSAEYFTNGNPTLECLEIIKEPIRADIPSKYSKEKKPGGGRSSRGVGGSGGGGSHGGSEGGGIRSLSGSGGVRSRGVHGGRGGSPENFTNGNPTLDGLEIIKEPIRADIPSKYSKEKKPGGGGRTKFVLKICRSIVAAVVSILVGDPTTLLANAMVEAVLQLLNSN